MLNNTCAEYNEPILSIDPKEVQGYTLRRSTSSPRLLNVVAMNEKGEAPFVVESDMDFDKASAMVDALNNPMTKEL